MNKAVTPKQLELTAGKTRAELAAATAPHIDPEGPAFKEDMAKVRQDRESRRLPAPVVGSPASRLRSTKTIMEH